MPTKTKASKQELTELQRAWLDALRSDEFEQGDSLLKNEYAHSQSGGWKTAYCCLGVACVVAQREGAIKRLRMQSGIDIYPPPNVMKAFGFIDTHRDGNDDNHKGTNGLSVMNDEKRMSFKRIAAAVERNPARFFVSLEKA